MNKLRKLIPFIILVMGLVVGLILIRRSQELRRGAAALDVDFYLHPGNGANLSGVNVGDTLSVLILGNGNNRSIGVVSLRIRYDKTKLKIDNSDNVVMHSLLKDGSFKEVKDGEGYVDVIGLAMGNEIAAPVTNINNPLLKINFTVLSKGSARVYVDKGWSDISIAGGSNVEKYNLVASANQSLDVTYDIGATGETPVPTATGVPQPTNTGVPQPTATLPAGAKVISFEVVMAGVRDYSKCLGSNVVDVVMLKGSNRKEYKNVPLVDTGKKNTKNETIFLVDKLNVTNFGEGSGVAVFVKGEKHLQMKYGINGQTSLYNKAGGELSFNNATVFDFTKYPMLAGDVNRDGRVDGIDFVEVKKRAAKFEEVVIGQTSAYDLDGSCVVNNADVVLLIQALNEKYDQLY